ncbi:hypothetical protein [Paraburkholderia youngii]|uniref:hypothetical protein n=1 Tax=Paraburkholderia youngii TaxID=2782701 RepID=UPI003D1D142C
MADTVAEREGAGSAIARKPEKLKRLQESTFEPSRYNGDRRESRNQKDAAIDEDVGARALSFRKRHQADLVAGERSER